MIFDSARGVIPGQLVKVAGAPVGSIKDVKVTPGYKARIELEVDRRFAPFKADARCSIQPEGLIAEYFVQCDPGTAGARPLRAGGGQPPTVPVERTTLPVGLMDLFELANVPVRDRARVLINELGIGLIARGEDLNAILRRTNPALQQARRGIALLNRQRADLDKIVRSTDRVAASLARRRGRVRDFIRGAARVTEVTGSRNAELSEAVRRLPALLRATQPALRAIDQFSADAEPLLTEVRAAAPGVATQPARAAHVRGHERRAAARPALDPGARPPRGDQGGAVHPPPRPLPRRGADHHRPGGRPVRRSRAAAASPRNLLELFYYGAAMSARYDEHGHILPSRLLDLPSCGAYATTPVAGCEARPGSSATRAPPGPAAQAPRAPPPGAGQARARAAGRPPAGAPPSRRRPAPAPQRRRPLPLPVPLPGDPPEQLPDELEDLLEYLLK